MAVQKMTNYDIQKTNASMNLIGSGVELPKVLNAVIDSVKEKYNPEVFDKAIKEIANRYTQRKNFIDESMKHMYGPDGNEVTNWALGFN